MLRRLLSLILIVTMLVACMPAVYAEDIAEDTPGYATLQRGDQDGDDSSSIVVLQNALIALDYLHDNADGIYGANTQKAVAAFQRVHGLEETGVADSATQDLLYNGENLINFAETDDPQSVSYRVDKMLNLWGFTGNVFNGVVNQTTDAAVPAFKNYLHNNYLISHPTPTPAPTAAPTADPNSAFEAAEIVIDTPIIKESEDTITQEVLDFVDGVYEFEVYSETVSNGDENDEVLRVQRRLYNLNYLAVANGEFDSNTERALIYFQKKNGLNQTGVADETTQRLLFSEAAVESEEFVNAYKFVVDESEQCVYVYAWNGSDYGTCVREMICSTGKRETPTPQGTYQAAGPTGTGEWYWFSTYECYAKYATRIVGGILFHSVTYTKNKNLVSGSVSNLGRRASHGCIRLRVEDAQWTYEHCVPGTTVIVRD